MEEPQYTSGSKSPPSSPPPTRCRQLCTHCDRPVAVCLCHALPPSPILTKTNILIIRHPHESRHKLNTTPLLSKTLLNATTISSRRLLPHHLPNESPPAIYLFPSSNSSPAVTLSQLKSSNLLNYQTTPLLLIVFDATWKHAKEMVSASEGVLKGFAVRVCLDGVNETVMGGNIYDNELLLRKEPFGGCVSTLEAVARCLGVIEPNGDEIQGVLVGVLKEMVRLQAGFLKPLKPRPKMLKKSKRKEEDNKELVQTTFKLNQVNFHSTVQSRPSENSETTNPLVPLPIDETKVKSQFHQAQSYKHEQSWANLHLFLVCIFCSI